MSAGKSFPRFLALSVILFASSFPIEARSALSTWTLDGVTFENSGTATGWFVFDDAANSVVDYKIDTMQLLWGVGFVTPSRITFEPGSTGCIFGSTCQFATTSPEPEIAFVQLGTPAITTQLFLAPEEPLTGLGGQVALVPGTRVPSLGVDGSYFSGQPYGGSINLMTEGTLKGVAGVIPEPSTYAMLLVGLGILGLMARRQRC